MSSDNIFELTYTSNLNAGAVYISEKVIIAQYISLNVLVKSNVIIKLVAQFSGDGTNWDYALTEVVNPGTNKYLTISVQGKWTRFIITNVDVSNSAYLRVFSYGTPTNSSILAQLSKIGNLNPVVDIGNLPPNFATPSTLLSYKFMAGPTNPTTSAFYSLYPTLYLNHQGAAGPTYSFTNQSLTLSTNNTVNAFDDIVDSPVQIPTINFITTLTAKFTFDTDSSTGGTAVVGMASNFGDRIAVGFYKTTPGFTGDDWGLYTYPHGFFTYIPRSSFNVDPCDGSVNLPFLDMTEFNTFQFVVSSQSVDFYVQYHNKFYMVHQIYYTSTSTPMFRDYSVGYFMRAIIPNTAVTTGGGLSVSCANWDLQSVGYNNNANRSIPRQVCYERTKNNVILEQPVFTLQNYTLYSGVSCIRTVALSSLYLARKTSGIPVTFRGYFNATLAGAVYGTISSYTNTRVDTTATLTTPGVLVFSVTLGPEESSIMLDQIIQFKQSDTFTITAEAPAPAEVIISTNIY